MTAADKVLAVFSKSVYDSTYKAAWKVAHKRHMAYAMSVLSIAGDPDERASKIRTSEIRENDWCRRIAVAAEQAAIDAYKRMT